MGLDLTQWPSGLNLDKHLFDLKVNADSQLCDAIQLLLKMAMQRLRDEARERTVSASSLNAFLLRIGNQINATVASMTEDRDANLQSVAMLLKDVGRSNPCILIE